MKYAFLDEEDNLLAYGEKIEAARKAFNFSLNGSILTAQPKGFNKISFHTYSEEYSPEEMIHHSVSYLISRASELWSITVLKQEN